MINLLIVIENLGIKLIKEKGREQEGKRGSMGWRLGDWEGGWDNYLCLIYLRRLTECKYIAFILIKKHLHNFFSKNVFFLNFI